MIRLLFLIAVVFGALYLVRWFLKTPAEDVAATIKKSLLFAVGIGLIVLAVTGRLHWLFAFLGAAIPAIINRLPMLLRLIGLAGTVKSAHGRYKSQQNNADSSKQTGAGPARMSRAQALDILGLAPDAQREDIIRAHRELIQKVHPDRGGSTHLAAQINQAKDVLLAK